ncbi:MAG: DUF4476 domain-containing protein [Flavobacterium sp.]|nr:MAG: DUF4476 domain-containing protein [Flavobacterium sp.]
MKLKLLFTVALTMVLTSAFAQKFGHLTIFSEDGDKFFLILNGEKINDVAQTNLRVEELTQPYYSAKIIFEDTSKQPISKNNLAIADVDDVYKDVTYKIKRDKNNASKMKLNFFSMTDVDPGFLPPSNVKIIHYGVPEPVVGTVTQTTTTTTSGNNNVGINAGVHIDGVGVGINMTVNDPNVQVSHSQTTTTTTVSSSHHQSTQENAGYGCSNGHCMSPANFNSALQSIKGQSFEDTKLKTAKQIASANCLTATQVADICRSFGFEESKLDFAKAAYSNCTEPSNYFKVNDVFSFSTSVDELTDYISAR